MPKNNPMFTVAVWVIERRYDEASRSRVVLSESPLTAARASSGVPMQDPKETPVAPLVRAGCSKRLAWASALSVALTAITETRPMLRNFFRGRSEEHTSELQSRGHLVCRLLLEKKKRKHSSTRAVKTDGMQRRN